MIELDPWAGEVDGEHMAGLDLTLWCVMLECFAGVTPAAIIRLGAEVSAGVDGPTRAPWGELRVWLSVFALGLAFGPPRPPTPLGIVVNGPDDFPPGIA